MEPLSNGAHYLIQNSKTQNRSKNGRRVCCCNFGSEVCIMNVVSQHEFQ
jgi:hypothetical protein